MPDRGLRNVVGIKAISWCVRFGAVERETAGEEDCLHLYIFAKVCHLTPVSKYLIVHPCD